MISEMRKRTFKNTAFLVIIAATLVAGYSYANEDLRDPSTARKSTPVPYDEIGIDSIQHYIINYERDLEYVYGLTPKSLVGLSLRAFKAWTRKYTGRDLPVLVFRYQEPDWYEDAIS